MCEYRTGAGSSCSALYLGNEAKEQPIATRTPRWEAFPHMLIWRIGFLRGQMLPYFASVEKNMDIMKKEVSKANDLHGRSHDFSDFNSKSHVKYVEGTIKFWPGSCISVKLDSMWNTCDVSLRRIQQLISCIINMSILYYYRHQLPILPMTSFAEKNPFIQGSISVK